MDADICRVLPVCAMAVTQLKRHFLVLRLHAASKFFSRDLALRSSGKKNRKASKVLHL